MKECMEKFLGVYGEDIRKLENDFWKKELPLSFVFSIASCVYPYSAFLSMYFSIRGIAHLEKLRRLRYKSYEERIDEWEKRIKSLLSEVK